MVEVFESKFFEVRNSCESGKWQIFVSGIRKWMVGNRAKNVVGIRESGGPLGNLLKESYCLQNTMSVASIHTNIVYLTSYIYLQILWFIFRLILMQEENCFSLCLF